MTACIIIHFGKTLHHKRSSSKKENKYQQTLLNFKKLLFVMMSTSAIFMEHHFAVFHPTGNVMYSPKFFKKINILSVIIIKK